MFLLLSKTIDKMLQEFTWGDLRPLTPALSPEGGRGEGGGGLAAGLCNI